MTPTGTRGSTILVLMAMAFVLCCVRSPKVTTSQLPQVPGLAQRQVQFEQTVYPCIPLDAALALIVSIADCWFRKRRAHTFALEPAKNDFGYSELSRLGRSTDGTSHSCWSSSTCASCALTWSEVRPHLVQNHSFVAGFHAIFSCFIGS